MPSTKLVSPKPAIEVITDLGAEAATSTASKPKPGRSPSASACVPYRETIELGLARGRNAVAIWQDLVDQGNFTAGYQSVRRFVRHLQARSAPEPRAVIQTAPGEEAQVDYGDGPMVRDPQTGKYRPNPTVCAHALVQPEVRPAADVPFQFPDLGRTA